eukprot:g4897.t1
MCGIIAYIGHRDAIPLLIKGLKRLEYRGYDSAGVGIVEPTKGDAAAKTSSDSDLVIVKKLGKVANLESAASTIPSKSTCGIAHTRWATHGVPSDRNSHPHANQKENICVVHNGIVENYSSLKEILRKKGYKFRSETDTEVLVHLIDDMKRVHKTNLVDAVHLALDQVEGTFGLAVVSSECPDQLIGARRGSPLIVGMNKGEYFLASDASAIVEYTSDVIYLKDNDVIVIERNKHEIQSLNMKRWRAQSQISRQIQHLEISRDEIEKGGYKYFMIKEIMDQPRTLNNCMRGRVATDHKSILLGGLQGTPMKKLVAANRLIVCACGTSWHAGIVGEYLIEHLAGISVEVEYASEFRYKKPVLLKDEDVILVTSQSGETADTLAAIREAKRQGCMTLGIVNVVGSTIGRETDAGVYLHAGPEIGVASTKAFTAQVMVFCMLALELGREKGKLSRVEYEEHVKALADIPAQISNILDNSKTIHEASKIFRYARNMLFLGRGFNFPVALEGALKLKEISYIHAEGYPSAELKHGPIALIDEYMPVVLIAPKADSAYEKIKANVFEASNHKGALIVITETDNHDFDDIAEFVFRIPLTKECFVPLLTVIPLQLLSYHIADMRGLDVDKPRNLAKSVTVE